MLDWTDRHCRYLHRQLTKRALLYTEMIVADAVIHGDRQRLLDFHPHEQPVALQLGGSIPGKLAEAAAIGEQFGYQEINLNVGCPSDRVQSGAFGACLMKTPDLVAECVAAMKAKISIPVTVKCRIAVDDQDPEEALDRLAKAVFSAGAYALWVHARKAWLKGLNPKENRDIPPLDYNRVYSLKGEFPNKFIGINGGIKSIDEAAFHLTKVDGVMLGRAAYQTPAILTEVESRIYGEEREPPNWEELIASMADYAERHIRAGGRLSQVARHMLNLFNGLPGARVYRRILSTEATKAEATPDILRHAFSQIGLPSGNEANAGEPAESLG